MMSVGCHAFEFCAAASGDPPAHRSKPADARIAALFTLSRPVPRSPKGSNNKAQGNALGLKDRNQPSQP